MRAILIGGRGFLGQYVESELLESGIECITAGRNPKNDLKIDLLEPDSIYQQLAISDADVVVNLAGAFENQTNASLEVNSFGPKNLISAIKKCNNPPKLVHIGSATEPRSLLGKGNFESTYSETKYYGTKIVFDSLENNSISGTILRVHNCYGEKQPQTRFIAWAVDKLKRGEQITLQHPDRIRDFCLVEEAASGISKLIINNSWRGSASYQEVGTGVGISLQDTAHIICDTFNVPRSLVRRPSVTAKDLHPSEVANLSENSLGLCKTNFKIGIRRSYGVN